MCALARDACTRRLCQRANNSKVCDTAYYTHLETRKLLQISKQVVTRLLSSQYQDVFAQLVRHLRQMLSGAIESAGTSC